LGSQPGRSKANDFPTINKCEILHYCFDNSLFKNKNSFKVNC
jgi:hypothetical protein